MPLDVLRRFLLIIDAIIFQYEYRCLFRRHFRRLLIHADVCFTPYQIFDAVIY